MALAVPVVYDISKVARKISSGGPPIDLNLLESSSIQFEPADVLIDFRASADRSTGLLAPPDLRLLEGWEEERSGGQWTAGDRANLAVRVTSGGQRTLLLRCKVNARRRPPPSLVIAVGGVELEPVPLLREIATYRFDMPAELMIPGLNEITFALSDDPDGRGHAAGRTLVVRRMALVTRVDADLDEVFSRHSIKLNHDTGAVTIRSPGVLGMLFESPAPGYSLVVRYRFRAAVADAVCDAVVGRWYADPGAIDVMTRKRLTGSSVRKRRFRVHLGNHAGGSVLEMTVDQAAAEVGFEILEARLQLASRIAEKDR